MPCINIDLQNPNSQDILFELGKPIISTETVQTGLIPAILPPSQWTVSSGVGVQLANQLEVQYIPYSAKYGVVKIYILPESSGNPLPAQIEFRIYKEYDEHADYNFFASHTPVFVHQFVPVVGFNYFACDTVVLGNHMLTMSCSLGANYNKLYNGGSLTSPAWFRRVVTPGYTVLGSFSSNSLFIYPESFENNNKTAIYSETIGSPALTTKYAYNQLVERLKTQGFKLKSMSLQAESSMLDALLLKNIVYTAQGLLGESQTTVFKLRKNSFENGFTVDYNFENALFISAYDNLIFTIPAGFDGVFTVCLAEENAPEDAACSCSDVAKPIEIEELKTPPQQAQSVCCWPWLILVAVALIKIVKHKNE